MQIECYNLGVLGANCYTVLTDTAALVIDPGDFDERIAEFLKSNSDKARLILLTHCHFDHIAGAKRLRDTCNVKIAIGEKDFTATESNYTNLAGEFGIPIDCFTADISLKSDELLKLGATEIKCIHTPGHTVGGMCYLIENVIFSGDTLFKGSIGRTDFPGGNFTQISASIKKLYNEFPNETVLYPGHESSTLLGYEKRYNPFVREV